MEGARQTLKKSATEPTKTGLSAMAARSRTRTLEDEVSGLAEEGKTTGCDQDSGSATSSSDSEDETWSPRTKREVRSTTSKVHVPEDENIIKASVSEKPKALIGTRRWRKVYGTDSDFR